MALTTAAGVTAALPGQNREFVKAGNNGAAGTWMSLWAMAGNPAAGSLSIGNTTTGVVPTSSTAGAFQFTNPSSGSSYLSQFRAACANALVAMLYDRQWHAGSFALTPAAPTTTTLTPAALTRPDANGAGTELWLEINVAPASATTITCSYTNQSGTAGQTATLDAALGATFGASRMIPFRLAAGDTGVRSVQSFTLGGTASATGSVNLIILKKISHFSTHDTGRVQAPLDHIGTGMPIISDSACLALMQLMQVAAGAAMTGKFSIIQG